MARGPVLVTGGTGFVGRALIARLLQDPATEVVAPARAPERLPMTVRGVRIGEIGPATDWSGCLAGVKVVVHAAARVHMPDDNTSDPLAAYRRVNVDGTLGLARQAAEAGARRLVLVSTVKVNGEQTLPGRPFTADSQPEPGDPYGVSKLEAEQGLLRIARETGLEVVIIRPPLVYGPGVKGNFATLVRLVEKGLPLPLGAVRNQRSLVGVDNLVDLIVTCMDHPAAASQVFLAADGEDVSTPELLRRLSAARGRRPRLVPVPPGLLMAAAAVLGRRGQARRLLGSLQVDISKTRDTLGWRPPLTLDEGLARCFNDNQGELM